MALVGSLSDFIYCILILVTVFLFVKLCSSFPDDSLAFSYSESTITSSCFDCFLKVPLLVLDKLNSLKLVLSLGD